MKIFRIMAAAGLAGAVIFTAAGCANYNRTGSGLPEKESETAVSETAEETVTKAPQSAHDVSVEDLSKTTYTDDYNNTYTSVYPKLIVDGKEATNINETISSYILKTYPIQIKTDYGYIEGYETSYRWGVMGNTVSIVIHASSIDSDYFTNEVFNYDLDTLKQLDDSEVVKRFGMTDEVFFNNTVDIIKKAGDDNRSYDLDKTVAAVNYDNVTPFVTSKGNPGVAASIYYVSDSQFGGSTSVRCFDMTTMEQGY